MDFWEEQLMDMSLEAWTGRTSSESCLAWVEDFQSVSLKGTWLPALQGASLTLVSTTST